MGQCGGRKIRWEAVCRAESGTGHFLTWTWSCQNNSISLCLCLFNSKVIRLLPRAVSLSCPTPWSRLTTHQSADLSSCCQLYWDACWTRNWRSGLAFRSVNLVRIWSVLINGIKSDNKRFLEWQIGLFDLTAAVFDHRVYLQFPSSCLIM